MSKRKGIDIYSLDEVEICRLYEQDNLNISQIAKKYSVNHGTIKLRLIRNNVKFRNHSETQKIAMNDPVTKKKISDASKRSSKQRVKTNIELYGVAVPANNPEKQEIWHEKHLEEHGVIWPNQRKDVRNSYKETCMKNHDVDNMSKVGFVKDKIKENRWRNKSKEELDEIQNKTKNTWIENLGVNNPLESPIVINTFKQNCIKKDGIDWPTKRESVKQKVQVTRLKNQKPKVFKKLKDLNIQLLDEFENVTCQVNLKCITCGTLFSSVLDYVFHGYGLCPKCFPPHTSRFFANEITNFIIKILPNETITRDTKKILPSKKELDIYIESKKFAIECDGLYYHCDEMILDKNYHLNKTIECEQLGINLIHIFEDEWFYKKDVVKNRLLNILGVDNKPIIHSKNCIIKNISIQEKNKFLVKYHLQGKDNSTVKLGAFYNDELVSVMTFNAIENKVFELSKFVSNYSYSFKGLESKLLTYFFDNYIWEKIVSYVDRRWSDNKLFYEMGFNLNNVIGPSYWWVNNFERIHKFDLTDIKQNKKYRIIWDCGSLKFELINNEFVSQYI